MSDIISAPNAPAASAVEQVLDWIERHIRQKRLGLGDALPGETQIAASAGTGRSSVREALTALKVLGIIRTRRKGGIQLVRVPALLELRHYFAPVLGGARFADAMEFRAAFESGLGPVMLARVSPASIRRLEATVDAVEEATRHADLYQAEIDFHVELVSSCGNALASLFLHMYAPLFLGAPNATAGAPLSPAQRTAWIKDHRGLATTLRRRDRAGFLRRLKAHTQSYLRLARAGGDVAQ